MKLEHTRRQTMARTWDYLTAFGNMRLVRTAMGWRYMRGGTLYYIDKIDGNGWVWRNEEHTRFGEWRANMRDCANDLYAATHVNVN